MTSNLLVLFYNNFTCNIHRFQDNDVIMQTAHVVEAQSYRLSTVDARTSRYMKPVVGK